MRRHIENPPLTTLTKKDQQQSKTLPNEFYTWLMQPSGSEIGLDKTAPIDVSHFPSIENRDEFEKFLQRHIVPPPPGIHRDENSSKTDPCIHQMSHDCDTNAPQRRVSFSAETTVNPDSLQKNVAGSFTGPMQRRNQSAASDSQARHLTQVGHLISVARQNSPFKNPGGDAQTTLHSRMLPNAYTTSSTIVETQVTVTQPKEHKDKIFKGIKSNFLSNKLRKNNSSDSNDSANLISEYDASRPSATAAFNPANVRRVSLKEYVGLEETDHTPPEVTSVPLRNFLGLENTNGGTVNLKSLKSEMEAINETPYDEGEFRASGSVDSLRSKGHDASPKRSSPLCPRHAAHLKMLSEEVDRVNSVLESGNIEQSNLVNRYTVDYSAAESRYPNYIYHRRRSSIMTQADEQAQQDSMWPTPEHDLTPIVSNGNLPFENHPDASEEDFERAKGRVTHLVDQLKDHMELFPAKSPRRALALSCQKSRLKNELLNESQQFAAAGKLLVRSVTEPRGKLLPCLEHSCDKAKTVLEASLHLISASEGLFQAQTLGAKVREVLVAFERTLDAAKNARGKPLGDSEMKRLMRQSTTLAATLTQLIRTIRET